MKTLLLPILTVFGVFQLQAQIDLTSNINHEFDGDFASAYAGFQDVPLGILEAFAYSRTRLTNLDPNEIHSCTDIPKAHGVFGLIDDPTHYFKNTWAMMLDQNPLTTESQLLASTEQQAIYFLGLYEQLKSPGQTAPDVSAIQALIGFPVGTNGQAFARDSELYQILYLLSSDDFMGNWGYQAHDIDMRSIFGNDLDILQAQKVIINGDEVRSEDGLEYRGGGCLDYPTAIWVSADPSNYSSRSQPISAITVHDIEGSYAGAISWFQNPSANVSAHYVLRSMDGQITQMVCEADMGWHVGSENGYTIGLEHEGYASTPSWYTLAMYQSSADLVRDICNDHAINPLRTYNGPACLGSSADCQLGGCIKVKGHQHYPNQTHTDPGIYWDWPFYYELINDNPTTTPYTAASGSLYDTGGPSADYGDDERYYMLIQPPGAIDITLTVNSFDIEYNWDYLYIYDGATSSDPMIGQFTGTSISSTITSSGGSLLLEFRSDCATTDPGWDMSWTSTAGPTHINELEEAGIRFYPNPAKEILTIEVQETTTLLILDLAGREVLNEQLNGTHITDVSHLSDGMYVIQFITNETNYSEQLIIH